MSEIKVAIVEPVGGHGGMDYYDFGLCMGLVEAGVTPVLYTCDETTVSRSLPFEVRLSYRRIFGSDPSWKRGIRYLFGSLRSMFHARFSGAAICHLHFFHIGYLEMFNVLLARMLGMRTIMTIHDVEPFVESLSVPFLVKAVYRVGDGVIVHNETSRAELFRHLGGRDGIVSVIPHGNYLHAIGEVPEKSEARKRLELPAGARVLLFFGQIKEVKGLDLLLEAMPSVIKSHPDVMLVIAGKVWKDDFGRYRRIIDERGLNDYCVTRIQYIADEEVPYYFSASDLVLLPYRSIYQSGVILMAMSYGKPVLASDIKGMAEVVTDGENGFLFTSEDVASLSERLDDILKDEEKLEAVAQEGARHIREKHDWNRIGRLTAEAYLSLLNAK